MIKNLSIVVFFILASCTHNQQTESAEQNQILSALPVLEASGFSLSTVEHGYQISVTNPWQEAKGVEYRYLLSDKENVSKQASFNEVIQIPVNRIVCLSTTHVAFIDRLGEADKIVGVSGANYVTSQTIRQRVDKGLIKDVGYEQALNYELLVSLKPDVVFAYGVGAEMAGYLQKLKDLSIPVMFIGDYLEENPLGKAEWIKVMGLLLDKYLVADSIFNQTATEYNNLKNSLTSITEKPKVFLNLPWKDVWYFPGGQGYLANLIADAGGEYSLSHLQGSRSYPFSIENSLEYAVSANIWLNTGTVNSLSELLDELPIVKGLPMLSTHMVFNNNNRMNPTGGNDFWESGVVYPQLILKDLIEIFHPNQIDHQLVYYKQLQ